MSFQVDVFNHSTSQIALEHLALKFGKTSKIITGAKPQRFGQNKPEHLEVDPMQVCLLQFRQAATTRRKTTVEEKITYFCLPSLTLGIILKYPLG